MNFTRTSVALIVSSLFVSVAFAQEVKEESIQNSNEFDIAGTISVAEQGIKLNYFGTEDNAHTANIKSDADTFNGWMIFQVIGKSSDVTFNFNATDFKFGVENKDQNKALLTLDMGKTQEGLSDSAGRTTYNLKFAGNSTI